MEIKTKELLSLVEGLGENDKKEFELEEIEMNFIKNLVKRRKN